MLEHPIYMKRDLFLSCEHKSIWIGKFIFLLSSFDAAQVYKACDKWQYNVWYLVWTHAFTIFSGPLFEIQTVGVEPICQQIKFSDTFFRYQRSTTAWPIHFEHISFPLNYIDLPMKIFFVFFFF